MRSVLKGLYIAPRFYAAMGGVIGLFLFAFAIPPLNLAAQLALFAVLGIVLADIFLLFGKGVDVQSFRNHSSLLSLGSDNPVRLTLRNRSALTLDLSVIDELPAQLQERNFVIRLKLAAGEEKVLSYSVRPLSRGEYSFGDTNLFLRFLGFVERRVKVPAGKDVPVYPSVIQMKTYEIKAVDRLSSFKGIKKMRRIGHSYEFEQIKNYVAGDDFRAINWKATSRRASLMINQYEDEKAQQVYSLIDKSRSMKMPFEGLTLLDHAINTSLVLSNVSLLKQDKAGLITFSGKIDTILKADRSRGQLQGILQALYRQTENPLESNYELLYHTVRKVVTNRSLLFLYTNFESMYSLERVLPILRKLNKHHLLVPVFFENTEVLDFSVQPSTSMEEIYIQTVAQNMVAEKRQIVGELRKYGIQSILSRPQDLSINTINKYLELKSRGMI
jgi:uncharacterized protein (DUF58 family)